MIMAFDTSALDEACLTIGDAFNNGAFTMVPTFADEVSNTDYGEVQLGERLTAQTTHTVIADNSIRRGDVITHDRTGNEFEVLGFLADDVNWVTVELERAS
jgi:hypothetical protein